MNNINVYEKITNDFIEAIKGGKIPWHQPWFGKRWAISHTNGRPYSFINQFLLGKDGEWLTFKQIQEEGGSIKKGCKAHYVVFWKFIPKTEKNEDGEEIVVGQFPILKFYNVWHISECEGIKEKYPVKTRNENSPIESAQKIFADYVEREKENGFRANISDINDAALYRPFSDVLEVPSIELFENSELYYSTLFHEMTHSTGAKKRLNREGIVNFDKFGSERYSKEELVAEMGAAFLCNQANLDVTKTFKNSAAYLQGWLTELKNDPKMIVAAASKAEQAVQYILNGEKPNHID